MKPNSDPNDMNNRPTRPPARPVPPPRGARPAGPAMPRRQVPGGQTSPNLDAAAAQRAARRAINRQYPSGRPQDPLGNEDYRGLPGSNRFAEEFFSDPPPEDEDTGKKILIRLVIGAAVVLVLLLLAFFAKDYLFPGSDVQLKAVRESDKEKVSRSSESTESSSETSSETTSETTTVATTTRETETLPPLGTDPYQNTPSWAPPTTEATLSPSTGLSDHTVEPAPPQAPAVQVQEEIEEVYVDESTEPIAEEYPSDANALPEDLGEAGEQTPGDGSAIEGEGDEVVLDPASEQAGNEQPSEEATVSETQALSSDELEVQRLAFPAVPAPADLIPLERNPGKIVTGGTGFSLVMNTGQQLFVEGRFDQALPSPDRSKVFAIAEDGRYLLYNPDGSAVELPMKAGVVEEGMIGNQGMIYLMDNQLYSLDYATQSISMIQENVDAALFAADSSDILMASGGGVYYLSGGNATELIAPGSAIGQINLLEITDDGGFISFEDESNVYIYRPHHDAVNVHSLTKVGNGQVQVFRSEPYKESLVVQTGSSVIYRITPQGTVEQVHLPNYLMTDTAYVMPCGPASSSAYQSFVLLDNTSVFVVNPTMTYDPAIPSYMATYVSDSVAEMVVAGNSLYFLDTTGQIYLVDVSGDVANSIQVLSNQGGRLLTSTQDGSALYYIQNENLMRRREDASTELILEGVKHFMMTPTASKIYGVTVGGGVVRVSDGVTTTVAEDGKGIYEDSFSMNPIVNQGGNYWLEDGRIGWLEGASVVYEP